MWVSPAIIGTTASRTLQARSTAAVLVIGSDAFTRAHLASVGCFNYMAAQTLTRVIKEHLSVKSVADLFKTQDVHSFLLPSIGPICLAVLGAAFELAGVGGDTPLLAWVQQSTKADAIVTFDTLKAHERKRQDAQTRARRATGTPRRVPRGYSRRVNSRPTAPHHIR